jgi:hypothetical protein
MQDGRIKEIYLLASLPELPKLHWLLALCFGEDWIFAFDAPF